MGNKRRTGSKRKLRIQGKIKQPKPGNSPTTANLKRTRSVKGKDVPGLRRDDTRNSFEWEEKYEDEKVFEGSGNGGSGKAKRRGRMMGKDSTHIRYKNNGRKAKKKARNYNSKGKGRMEKLDYKEHSPPRQSSFPELQEIDVKEPIPRPPDLKDIRDMTPSFITLPRSRSTSRCRYEPKGFPIGKDSGFDAGSTANKFCGGHTKPTKPTTPTAMWLGSRLRSLEEKRDEPTDEELEQLISQLTKHGIDHKHARGALKSCRYDPLLALKHSEKLMRLEEARLQKEHLEKLATIDPLTGAENRKAYNIACFECVAQQRLGKALFIIDVDHFKQFNDTKGHQHGDEVLKTLVDVLKRVIVAREGRVFRLGGDEFACLLSEPKASCLSVGKLVQDYLKTETLEKLGEEVTLSIGIAELERGVSVETWENNADKALYGAKERGRDSVVWYTPELKRSISIVSSTSDQSNVVIIEEIPLVQTYVVEEGEGKVKRVNGICNICMEKPSRTHAFVPCGHTSTCGDCARKLLKEVDDCPCFKKCPECRREITGLLRFYLT